MDYYIFLFLVLNSNMIDIDRFDAQERKLFGLLLTMKGCEMKSLRTTDLME